MDIERKWLEGLLEIAKKTEEASKKKLTEQMFFDGQLNHLFGYISSVEFILDMEDKKND